MNSANTPIITPAVMSTRRIQKLNCALGQRKDVRRCTYVDREWLLRAIVSGYVVVLCTWDVVYCGLCVVDFSRLDYIGRLGPQSHLRLPVTSDGRRCAARVYDREAGRVPRDRYDPFEGLGFRSMSRCARVMFSCCSILMPAVMSVSTCRKSGPGIALSRVCDLVVRRF